MDSGTWADWATAALTGGGLAAAVFQLRAGRRDNRAAEDRRRNDEHQQQVAMARAVGVKIEWGSIDPATGLRAATFELLNSSPYPVSGVRVDIATSDVRYPLELVVGTVLPGERVVETRNVDGGDLAFGELTGGVTANFTDVFDNHWARTPDDLRPLEYPARTC